MTNGYRDGQPIYCPVNCQNINDCPYAKEGRCCADNPSETCEEFSWFFPSWEKWEEA